MSDILHLSGEFNGDVFGELAADDPLVLSLNSV